MPIIDLEKARIHYELSGRSGGPVLVLSHSIGADLTMWNEVEPAFAAHFQVLRLDTRGHGRSSVPEEPYTISDLADDVLSLLDTLGIERCSFCGLSLGGVIGMWLGIHASNRLDRLILANTAARIGTREIWNDRIDRVRSSGMEPMADAVMVRWFTERFRQTAPDVVARIRSVFVETSPMGYANCCAALRDIDLTDAVQAIETPTLVIASRFDPATSVAEGRFLSETIPRARYRELATAHLSANEDPRGFNDAVLEFLKDKER